MYLIASPDLTVFDHTVELPDYEYEERKKNLELNKRGRKSTGRSRGNSVDS